MNNKLKFLIKNFLWIISIVSLIAVNADIIVDSETSINPNLIVKVYLDTIKINTPIRQSKTKKNKLKDKICLQITEYSNLNEAKEYRIPSYPKHWLHRDLFKLRNIMLWQGVVESLESKDLILSLVETNFLPLNSDKSLGSIKLKLDNKDPDQNLKIFWDKAGFKERTKIRKIINKKCSNYVVFYMEGKNSNYVISFYVTTKVQK